MKKVLFATTALVASAGFAAADMSIKGSAEMGIIGGDLYGVNNDSPSFHNDFTITVDGTGETDGGLTFGFHVEIEETNGSRATNGAASYDNESVFISGAFGTLTMGEIDGAYDKRLQEVALGGGSIADDETVHGGYNGNGGFDGVEDNQILRYDYAFGDLGFSVSLEQENNGQDLVGDDSDMIWGVGVSYGMAFSGVDVGLGLGYQSFDDDVNTGGEIVGLSVHGDFNNGFEAALNYSDRDLDAGTAGDYEHVAIGGAYSFDAWTIGANYGTFDFGAGGVDVSGFGLTVNYDLGGGAVIKAGYGTTDPDVGADTDSYSFGVAMKF